MKYVGPILIGLVAGIVVAFGMGLLFASVHADSGFLPVYMGGFIGVFTAYILANLAGNRKVATASGADRQAALASPPPAGKGMIYVYRDSFIGMAAGVDVAIDDKPVAQLKSPRFTAVAVSPGVHTVAAAFGGFAGAQNRRGEAQVQVAAGQSVTLRIGVSMGMIQNTVTLVAQPDPDAVKRKLAGVSMTVPELAEI